MCRAVQEAGAPHREYIYRKKSILSSSFPDCWKAAIVTPVLKSPNNTSLSNFRPISVLPVFSKLLERVVSDQIIAHFCKHNLFSEKQSGFRYGHSTQDVLLHVNDSFLSVIDNGHYVGAVFLDLAKTFDCVDHYFTAEITLLWCQW